VSTITFVSATPLNTCGALAAKETQSKTCARPSGTSSAKSTGYTKMGADKTLREHCSEMGKRGGSVKSERKTKAARANASKPRPKLRELNALRRAKNNLTNS
jgi:hypothetical protein